MYCLVMVELSAIMQEMKEAGVHLYGKVVH